MKSANENEAGRAAGSGATRIATDASLGNLLPLAWPLFVVMWLVFPAASVLDLLGTNLTPVRLIAFLVLMAAYVAVYLRLMLRYPFRGGESSSRERRESNALLVALAALALCLEAAYGGGIPYHLMFVVIAAAVTLSARQATLAVVAIIAAASGIYALRSGWVALLSSWESAVAPFAIVGFSMIIASRLVLTVGELRAAREELARLAVAEERLRFARDLHDLLGHSLALITLKSELAGRLLPAAPERAATEVHDIEGVARQALREVREAVAGYRQPTLDEELEGAREMLEAASISCWIERGPVEGPPRTDAVLAWAVREGVTNVMRHSRADHCEIRVGGDADEVRVEISDDGRGSSGAVDEPGSGLSGLAERVAASGGRLETESPPAGGYRLSVSLPLVEGPVPPGPHPSAGSAREGERR